MRQVILSEYLEFYLKPIKIKGSPGYFGNFFSRFISYLSNAYLKSIVAEHGKKQQRIRSGTNHKGKSVIQKKARQ